MGDIAFSLVSEGKAKFTVIDTKFKDAQFVPGDRLEFAMDTPAARFQANAQTAAKDLGSAAGELESAMYKASDALFVTISRLVKAGAGVGARTVAAVFGVGALKGFVSDIIGESGEVTPDEFKMLLSDATIRKEAVKAFETIREEEGNIDLTFMSGGKKVTVPLRESDDYLMKLLKTPVGSEDTSLAYDTSNFDTAANMYEEAKKVAQAALQPAK